MKTFVTAVLIAGFMLGLSMQNAEAKRFGGGISFGGKNSFSTPFKRSMPPQKAPVAPNKASPASGAAAGAGKAGLMGALGGLAMGGLLGAMFFGGAFENINFLDILIFGLIAFVLFRLFAGRRRPMEPQAAGGAPMGDADWGREDISQAQQRRAFNDDRGFDTDIMFKDKKASSAPSSTPEGYAAPESIQLPRDFNKEEFLNGARKAFTMLQKAWDDGEMADIRGLTTDKVFAEIQDQFFAREGENQTDVLEATAEIIDYQLTSNEKQVAVLFNVHLREFDSLHGEQVHWVQEVWHFVQPVNSFAPTWFLDGIQQVEE